MNSKKSQSVFVMIFVAICLATCFFAGVISLLVRQNLKTVVATDTYNLTLVADSGFEDVLINDEDISYIALEEGTEVTISYGFMDHKVFDTYLGYDTDDEESIFDDFDTENIGEFISFVMPAHNLTVELTSKDETFEVKVHANLKKSNTAFDDIVLEYVTDIELGSNQEVTIDASAVINYNIYPIEIDGVETVYYSNLENVTFDEENLTITIGDIQRSGDVYISFEKKTYEIILDYGSNSSRDNKIGGMVTIDDSDYIFQTIENGIIKTYIYRDADAILSIQSNEGYKYNDIICVGEYDYVGEIDQDGKITINNVYSTININVGFLQTFEFNISVAKVNIDGESVELGSVWFADGVTGLSRIVAFGDNVAVQTEIFEEYSRIYEFKYWKITTLSGAEANLEMLELTENDLKNQNINVKNIYAELKLEANFGRRNFEVITEITGNRLGSVELITTEDIEIIQKGGDTAYVLKFGGNLSIKLTPKDEMHFLKSTILVVMGEGLDDENIEELNEKEDCFEYTIKNITTNLIVKITFVSNTWWEQMEKEGILDIYSLRGEGTEEQPYLIGNIYDLAYMSYLINNGIEAKQDTESYLTAHYALTADIDCGTEYYFVPIGTIKNTFAGTFDYRYHKISNITTESPIEFYSYEGLFSQMAEEADIINQHRSYRMVFVTLGICVAIGAVTMFIVWIIEKVRRRKKKVITMEHYKKTNNIIDNE